MTDTGKALRKGVHMTQIWRERVGENIRLLREGKLWTQTDLLKRLRDLSGDPEFYKDKGSISLIEKGLSAPSWDKMLQITRLFNTSLEVLAGLEPAAPSPSQAPEPGGQETAKVVEQVLAQLRAHGVLRVCPACQGRAEALEQQPESQLQP